MLQVGFGVFHDRRDILYAGDQIAGAGFVKRRRRKDRFDDWGHGLIDVKGSVVLPAAIEVEFPMDAG